MVLRTLLLGLCICLISCGVAYGEDIYSFSYFSEPKYDKNFTRFDYVPHNIKKGGKIVFGVEGGYNGFNLFTGKNDHPHRIDFIYDTLMIKSGDRYMEFYPLLAESYNVEPDYSIITFNLNPKAVWSDGVVLTAEDVEFTFNTFKKYGGPVYQQYYHAIDSAEALDKLTVKFTLSAKNRSRDMLLSLFKMPILPKHYYQDNLDLLLGSLPPKVTSGPYYVADYKLGYSVTYARNKSYWGQDVPANIGRNNFDYIVLDYYKNDAVAVEAFKSGACDVRIENISKRWVADYNIPEVADGRIVKRYSPYRIPQGAQGFILNTRRPFLSDVRVRKALSCAFDFDWINKHLMHSTYTRSNSHFCGSLFATGSTVNDDERKILERYGDKVSADVFEEIIPCGSDGDRKKSMQKSVDLLREAGFSLHKGKLRDSHGRRVKMEFLVAYPSLKRVMLPYIRVLERLGIDAYITVLDLTQYKKRTRNFDYDVILDFYPNGSLYVTTFRNHFHSEGLHRKGGSNYAGVHDEVVDDLLSRIEDSVDKDEVVRLVRALDRVLLVGHYSILHWYLPALRVLYWNKFGTPKEGAMPYGWELDYWWYTGCDNCNE